VLAGVPVWRSTVVRAANSVHVCAGPSGDARGQRRALRALPSRARSKDSHWMQLCRSTPQRAQRLSSASGSESSCRSGRSGQTCGAAIRFGVFGRARPAARVRARAPAPAAAVRPLRTARLPRPDIHAGGTCGHSWCWFRRVSTSEFNAECGLRIGNYGLRMLTEEQRVAIHCDTSGVSSLRKSARYRPDGGQRVRAVATRLLARGINT